MKYTWTDNRYIAKIMFGGIHFWTSIINIFTLNILWWSDVIINAFIRFLDQENMVVDTKIMNLPWTVLKLLPIFDLAPLKAAILENGVWSPYVTIPVRQHARFEFYTKF